MNGVNAVVEAIVAEKVQQNEMFTAHDITLEARNRGHRVGHQDVKTIVHDYYNRGNMGIAYERSTISVPLGGTPFLYHRSVDDPTTYQNIRGQGQVPNPTTQTITIPNLLSTISSVVDNGIQNVSPFSPFSTSTGDNTDNIGRKPDARQTLSIPANLLRQAGFTPNQQVYVTAVNNTLEISSVQQANSHTYTVDKGNQVRIVQSVLVEAGIGGIGETYDCSLESGKVVVKKSSQKSAA